MVSLFLRWLLYDTHSNSLGGVSLLLLLGGLDSSGLSLFLKFLFSLLLSLHFVDGLNQDSLVLELITLGSQVEVMVDILGDLLCFSILSKKSSENSLSSHPDNLGWHSCVSGTLSLTSTVMSSLSLGLVNSLDSRFRVHADMLSDDKSVLEQLTDVLSGVGEGDFVGLVGVDPNSLLSALQHSSSQSFLQSQKCHQSLMF